MHHFTSHSRCDQKQRRRHKESTPPRFVIASRRRHSVHHFTSHSRCDHKLSIRTWIGAAIYFEKVHHPASHPMPCTFTFPQRPARKSVTSGSSHTTQPPVAAKRNSAPVLWQRHRQLQQRHLYIKQSVIYYLTETTVRCDLAPPDVHGIGRALCRHTHGRHCVV